MPTDFLVVGLGNPGGDFERSRHNSGADTVALLARRHGAALKIDRRARALAGTASVGGRRVVLALPQTYYNDSGITVLTLAKRHDLLEVPERIVIVHDELDLPVGRLKVKVGGGLAGNKGLQSIKAHLHTDAFVRVRIGVGKPPGRQEGANHVLRRPGRRERVELDTTIEEAADAVELVVAEGAEPAMTRFNRTDG
ncbi:MAG TPA: aminoacyl-tRNA hydrolase [Acidimicrobiales bacterium]|nr:aminoacyl-tRNA hydrolase [Acidimicrobiales bacterium]